MSTTPTHLDLVYDRAIELYAVEHGVNKKQVVQSALDEMDVFKTYLAKAKKFIALEQEANP